MVGGWALWRIAFASKVTLASSFSLICFRESEVTSEVLRSNARTALATLVASSESPFLREGVTYANEKREREVVTLSAPET